MVLLRLQNERYLKFWNLKNHGMCVATRGQEKPPKAAGGYIGMCIQYKNWKVHKIKENMLPFKIKNNFPFNLSKRSIKNCGQLWAPP